MLTNQHEQQTDRSATEDLGTTTQMAEKHEIHSTDLVEQVKMVFIENLRDCGWRPVNELEGLIPDELANARLATVNALTIADLKDPRAYGRLLLRMDAVKALVDEGLCEVRGAEGREESCLVAQAAVEATAAASPASTKSNRGDTNASQATTKSNTQNSDNVPVTKSSETKSPAASMPTTHPGYQHRQHFHNRGAEQHVLGCCCRP
jgi:hypothetical protein